MTCEVCGRELEAATRCTNGRCPTCHGRWCTEGGTTSPGHARRWPWAMASKLTASYSGWSSPAEHAVPWDAPRHDATALCGIGELVVIEDGSAPLPFEPDGYNPCKRCLAKIRKRVS